MHFAMPVSAADMLQADVGISRPSCSMDIEHLQLVSCCCAFAVCFPLSDGQALLQAAALQMWVPWRTPRWP